MTIYDDPNRESIGLEPIWTGAGPELEPQLDKMTKAELLDHARSVGLGDDVDDDMTKAEIRDVIG